MPQQLRLPRTAPQLLLLRQHHVVSLGARRTLLVRRGPRPLNRCSAGARLRQLLLLLHLLQLLALRLFLSLLHEEAVHLHPALLLLLLLLQERAAPLALSLWRNRWRLGLHRISTYGSRLVLLLLLLLLCGVRGRQLEGTTGRDLPAA